MIPVNDPTTLSMLTNALYAQSRPSESEENVKKEPSSPSRKAAQAAAAGSQQQHQTTDVQNTGSLSMSATDWSDENQHPMILAVYNEDQPNQETNPDDDDEDGDEAPASKRPRVVTDEEWTVEGS